MFTKLIKVINPNIAKIFLIIVFIFCFLAFNIAVFSTNNSINYDDPHADVEFISITEHKLAQHFFANEPIRSIKIDLYIDDNKGPVEVAGKLYEVASGRLIGQSNKVVGIRNAAETVRFEFPNTESFALSEYIFELEALEPNRKINIRANFSEYDEFLSIDGSRQAVRMIFEAIYGNYYLLSFLMMTIILLCVSLVLLLFPQKMKLKTQELFIIVALISGLALVFISPSGQEPDGGDHILRAFDVSFGNITPILGKTNDNIIQMPDNFPIFNDTIIEPNLNQGYSRTQHMLNSYFSSEMGKNDDYHYNSSYSALTYYPQGLGLYLGRVFNLNQYYTLSLARIINLLAYIGLGYVAIALIPTHKNLLMVIALLPISIFQAGSLSADATINGFSFIFVASLLKITFDKRIVNVKSLILPVLLLYIIYLAKPAYIGLALLFLIIPFNRYPKILNITLSVMVSLGALVGVIGIILALIMGKIHFNEGLPVYDTQLNFVLNNLWPTAKIFFHTLNQNAFQYIWWLNMLGWINYSLGILIILVPAYIIIVGIQDREADLILDAKQSFIVVSAVVATLVAIFVGLYIYDDVNTIGAPLMLGVQGRYFIPILILPFIAIRNKIRYLKDEFYGYRIAGISGIMLTYTAMTLTKLIY